MLGLTLSISQLAISYKLGNKASVHAIANALSYLERELKLLECRFTSHLIKSKKKGAKGRRVNFGLKRKVPSA